MLTGRIPIFGLWLCVENLLISHFIVYEVLSLILMRDILDLFNLDRREEISTCCRRMWITQWKGILLLYYSPRCSHNQGDIY